MKPRSYDWRTWTDTQIGQFITARENDTSEGTQDLIDRMRDELEARDEYRAEHDDTPSLQDSGNELGSYGS